MRKSYGSPQVVHGITLGGRRRRIRRPGRPFRLRQVDPAADGGGLEEISAGTIRIGGRVVNTLEPKDRDCAMVFQNYALYPHMSVYENMAYGLKIRALPKAEIDATRAARPPRSWNSTVSWRASRDSCPADSGSGWRWAARSCASRRRSCSTNRCRISTPSCGADTAGDPEAPPASAYDQPVRHARPGRGDDAGAANDRDERRPRRTGRHAR